MLHLPQAVSSCCCCCCCFDITSSTNSAAESADQLLQQLWRQFRILLLQARECCTATHAAQPQGRHVRTQHAGVSLMSDRECRAKQHMLSCHAVQQEGLCRLQSCTAWPVHPPSLAVLPLADHRTCLLRCWTEPRTLMRLLTAAGPGGPGIIISSCCSGSRPLRKERVLLQQQRDQQWGVAGRQQAFQLSQVMLALLAAFCCLVRASCRRLLNADNACRGSDTQTLQRQSDRANQPQQPNQNTQQDHRQQQCTYRLRLHMGHAG